MIKAFVPKIQDVRELIDGSIQVVRLYSRLTYLRAVKGADLLTAELTSISLTIRVVFTIGLGLVVGIIANSVWEISPHYDRTFETVALFTGLILIAMSALSNQVIRSNRELAKSLVVQTTE
ncbi:MAG: hypothetical protein JWM07_137 [Candidatus Saccharibacteria bacterium]|nr:hypothetical protein [Candidatus Saccharibacteria bacterium]